MAFSVRSRLLAVATAAVFIAGGALVAQPAFADTVPSNPSTTPATVSDDVLPSVQIDGVVWNQQIVGNTVFVGGDFSTARPAGAAPGVNTVPRTGMLSYNLTTGVLNDGFNPAPNARIRGMALSPDKSTLYVAGNFTSIAGQTRYRLAAFNTATGQLTSFAPNLNGRATGVAVTNDTVYVVGAFTTANGMTVTNAAAYSTSGTLRSSWKPVLAGGQPLAVVAKPDNSRVVLGGNFQSANGSSNPGYGLASVDSVTGTTNYPFNVNSVVRNANPDPGTSGASISSLAADADGVYGTGQHYGTGTLEGTFFASWDNGDIKWVEDCHGDSYSVWPSDNVVYTTSHAHYCGNIGGFPQTTPWTTHKALAFTKAATGTITADPYGYTNWAGTPSPTLLNWFPDINDGSFTGLNQGAWTISGNSDYVLYGGEFTAVNSVKQQGIVRFASKALAPNKDGPRLSGSTFVPNGISLSAGTARISWAANYDRDNATLKYEVIRNSGANAPVYTVTKDSNFYTRPAMGFIDTGLTPGATYTYRIKVSDPFGNSVSSNTISVTAASSGSISDYAKGVLNDNPADYWRLGDSSGPSVVDWAGFNDAVAGSGVTFGAAGAIASDSNTAATFSGDGNGLVSSQTAIAGPNTFALEAWFKTTSTTGGKIIGFGDKSSGDSGHYDRHIYMDGSGRVFFGVYPGTSRTLQTATGLNDGTWHHVVGNLGPSGMQLYLDGVRVGQRSDTTYGEPYSGYWRIGGDSTWAGDNYFDGTIDDVAVYNTPLSIQQVNAHYVASGRTSPIPAIPSDSYGARVYNDSPDLYWRLGETSGTKAADSGVSGNSGVYSGGVTQGTTGAIAGTSNKAATFDGSSGLVSSSSSVSSPNVYSEELWFNSTSNRGGKLIGFGSNQTGNSGSYDRHVYLQDDGRLVFGAWTGQANVVVSPGSYTDGLWHHMVASQGPSGMALYVDGQLVGTNPQTAAQPYDGYWRVGGDTTWGSSSAYVAAKIDEVAVYSSVLSAETVAAHYQLGVGQTPNVAPTASFTATPSLLKVAVDGTASTDSDGSVSSYAWNFGDGTTGTGATTSHPYAAGGTYTVTLTVTDNGGATATSTQTVVIPAPAPNVPPTAAFTTTVSDLAVSADASTSADSDGTIASYAWDFGDGYKTTGKTASHTYSAGGTYTISLTVTDDAGAPATKSSTVSVQPAPPANVPPTASFTSSSSFLSLAVNGSASTDSDGTIASYAWAFGDGGTATGATASHPYASAGTYQVSLTVTDDKGATNTTTSSVTVTAPPANVAPTAAFTSTVSNLAVSVNGSASSDPDGTIASYAWNFGDGGLATGATAAHNYVNAGTYTVTLTVTDNAGATGTSTGTVTTVAPPGAVLRASDAFSRTVANGFGSADVGGAWTISGGASNFAVSGGKGRVKATAAGATSSAYLNATPSTDNDVLAQVSLDTAATGTGSYISVIGRKVGSNDYRAKLRFYPDGRVTLSASGGQTIVLPGVAYTAGDQLMVRVQVTGTAPTTIRAKVWRSGDAEPTAWQSNATDATAGMQTAGSAGVELYLPTSATTFPVSGTFDNFAVSATQ